MIDNRGILCWKMYGNGALYNFLMSMLSMSYTLYSSYVFLIQCVVV